MADVEDGAVQQSAESPGRTPWVAPEMTRLPVAESATQGSTGNDGNGPTTHS